MKLAHYALYRYRLPLLRPLTLRGADASFREGFILELETDTRTKGWGEVAPLPGLSSESPDQARQQICELASAKLGHDMDAQAVWSRAYAPGSGLASSVRFGFESAWLDTLTRQAGLGLHAALADESHASVPVNALLSDFSPASIEAVQQQCAAGYTTVKVKVGRGPVREEADALRHLLTQLPEPVRFRLDANRAWNVADAVWFARQVASPRIDYIEEPVRDTEDLYEFMGESPIPAALDEALVEQGGRALRDFDGIGAAVLKPTLLGGLVSTLSLAEAAWKNHVQPVISATFETGIGTAALAHLAAAVQAPAAAAGLDTYRWLSEDIVDPPLDMAKGHIDIEQLSRTLTFLRTDSLEKVAHG